MEKAIVWMLGICLAAQASAGTREVVVREKASALKRQVSPESNSFEPAVDWLKDYVLPERDARLLKGRKLTAYVLDSRGARTKRYRVFASDVFGNGHVTVSVRPAQTDRVWNAHELGGVAEIVVVGR